MRKYIYIFSLLICGMLTSALFTSCSKNMDEEVVVQQEQTCKLTFHSTVKRYNASHAASVSAWNDKDCIYLLFINGDKRVSGKAIYSKADDSWELYYNGSIQTGTTATCYAYFFENEYTIQDDKVIFTPQTAIYRDLNATYSKSANEMRVNATLVPLTGRIRFVGEKGLQFNVSGLQTYSALNLSDGTMTRNSNVLELTVNNAGTTDSIYALLQNDSRTLTLSYNQMSFIRICERPILDAGQCGYMQIPTEQAHNGWDLKKITEASLSAVTLGTISNTSVDFEAQVTDLGNGTLIDAGFVYSTNPNPTLDSHLLACGKTTNLKAQATNLTPETTYYVRAYATNEKGVNYGQETAFVTSKVGLDVWDGISVATKFSGGAGSENDPIIISSAEELALLAKNVNNGITYAGVYFKLIINVSLNNYKWTPIGTSAKLFSGTFDGNENTVSGLYINGYDDYIGLFGNVSGTILNLNIAGSVSGNNYVGGIAGAASGASIIECINECSVNGKEYVGGITGYEGSIVSCVNKGVVTGIKYVAGISGQVGEMRESTNWGNISGSDCVGGIVGFWTESSKETESYFISDCANYGNVKSTNEAGGIIGRLKVASYGGTTSKYDMYRRVYCNIYNCANYAKIEGQYSGGICGYAEAIGSFTNRTYGKETYLGIIEFSNCINNSVLLSVSYAGAILGYGECVLYSTNFYGGTISINSSYWLNDIANQIGIEAGCGGTNHEWSEVSSGWYSHNNSSCLFNNNDILLLLNQWVTGNSNSTNQYKIWKYTTIEGYACPVFE